MAEAWSRFECEATVRDYFSMFREDVIGENYNKAEHRRALQTLLKNRSEGSIEYKHQNISAILLELGYPYISGYKPAFNYQRLLRDVVLGHIAAHSVDVDKVVSSLSESLPKADAEYDFRNILDDAPEKLYERVAEQIPSFIPTKYNYAERESANRALGTRGEEFVLQYEKYRLKTAGRTDLAKEVEWTAREQGDGAGYDIKSFDETRDRERFIEVKTTNSGKYQPFLITSNELAFAAARADQYSLYRVFNFRSQPTLFVLPGNIGQYVNLSAKVFWASF